MKTLAFFDTKPYERLWFDRLKNEYGVKIRYFESKLNADTAILTQGSEAVCAFVNDDIDKDAIDVLHGRGVKLLAMRCAGYNNVDIRAAQGVIKVVRVPDYSPYAVAEHAMALLLTLNRKTHKAYIRTRDFNFSLIGLTGFDLHGKTVGVVGTGKIGRAFIKICEGFGMKVLAYDPYPVEGASWEYTDIEDLCRRSDVISLHCPLTRESRHIIGHKTISQMKSNAIIINTSRGELIDSEELLKALTHRRIGGACLDVYEEESELFFSDYSDTVKRDETLAMLLSMPNVIVSSHQAFFTDEALEGIARVTLSNVRDFLDGKELVNEIKYS
ncbi:MAG: 2-hydroxyacid dehydrogenase [Clostridia bacterium]|nr:2-hydroxyacid dehydrogenase [Clostridia bacterium]